MESLKDHGWYLLEPTKTRPASEAQFDMRHVDFLVHQDHSRSRLAIQLAALPVGTGEAPDLRSRPG
jgi:hypothetical protein